jgi:hypothetical protein
VKVVIAALSLVLLVSGHNSSRLSQETKECGSAVDGLQLCLTGVAANLQLSFTNVGDRDITLNLGIVLANGKMQSPTQVAIRFRDSQGRIRRFEFFDKRYSGIGGRIDDYVVPLPAHSTYTLQFSLDQFWCQETKEFSIPLLAGDNYLTAEFAGTGANVKNGDMQGIKFMNFWRSKVESNTLRLSQ